VKLYTDADASLQPLDGKTVAILGYGNQGRAQALNLRDNGVKVLVGNRQDSYFEQAQRDGFEPIPILEAAHAADFLLILTTDESQPQIWEDQIAPGISSGNTLVWASGYNVGYRLIQPPTDVDVIMVAPRMTGNMVRTLYEHGKGAMAQVAVHQDASGLAWERMMAIARGIGATRGGVFESSFREEAELDLFAEQVVWAGLVAWIQECFKLGVENGFSPELMVLELYASGEAAEILGMMAKNGFFKQMTHHSTTSQYGTLSRARELLNDDIRTIMRHSLLNDIKGGAFVKEWSGEQATGSETLAQLKDEALNSPMSQAEDRVISLVQQAHTL
jgi:ketol-acid reductoisomerase